MGMLKQNPKGVIVFNEETRTKQADKNACDINKIVAKYRKDGTLPALIKQNGRYGDFSSGIDYMDAMMKVRTGQEQFEALPSHVRKKFSNDPAEFLEFATDPKNMAELVKMGLAVEREVPEATPLASQVTEAKGETEALKQESQ